MEGWAGECVFGLREGETAKVSVGGVLLKGWRGIVLYLISLGGERWEFSVLFGPGLDSMSPARRRHTASHAAGSSHDWLPKKIGCRASERGRNGWAQFAQL